MENVVKVFEGEFKNCQKFWHIDDNTVEVYHLLSDETIKAGIENEIVITDKNTAIGKIAERTFELLRSCSHGEVDTIPECSCMH